MDEVQKKLATIALVAIALICFDILLSVVSLITGREIKHVGPVCSFAGLVLFMFLLIQVVMFYGFN